MAMDRDVALVIVNACYRSARELGELAPLVRDHCSPEEQAALRQAIGGAVHDIMENIAAYVWSRNPEAKAETEARLERFGRVS
jgi:hypothetical protein